MVSLVSGNGQQLCADTLSQLLILIPTGSNLSASDEKISIFPNPGQGYFTLAYSPSNTRILSDIEVYDATGRQIKTVSAKGLGSGRLLLDLNGFAAGVYQVKVVTDMGQYTTKLFIE